jgi:2-dehydro-3-deoxyphosphogluconate aldolase/(4S)-4-hydroxy-2-oxoglutarate aldolase
MNNTLKRIAQLQIIPVVVIDVEEHAMPLADALVAGGLPIAEITFRTDAAEAAIRTMAARGDLLVGAGTVLTTEQADRAIDAGATFIVAPGTNRQLVEHCLKRDIPITPGVATPTDIELALSMGLETLKFFPAQALGGIPMLKAISAPYRQVRFVPTGGITLDNMLDYLALPQVLACGGSWLVSRDKLANSQFDAIQDAVAAAVSRLASS